MSVNCEEVFFFFVFFLGNKSNQKSLKRVEGLIGNKEYIILIKKLIFLFWGVFLFLLFVFLF